MAYDTYFRQFYKIYLEVRNGFHAINSVKLKETPRKLKKQCLFEYDGDHSIYFCTNSIDDIKTFLFNDYECDFYDLFWDCVDDPKMTKKKVKEELLKIIEANEKFRKHDENKKLENHHIVMPFGLDNCTKNELRLIMQEIEKILASRTKTTKKPKGK